MCEASYFTQRMKRVEYQYMGNGGLWFMCRQKRSYLAQHYGLYGLFLGCIFFFAAFSMFYVVSVILASMVWMNESLILYYYMRHVTARFFVLHTQLCTESPHTGRRPMPGLPLFSVSCPTPTTGPSDLLWHVLDCWLPWPPAPELIRRHSLRPRTPSPTSIATGPSPGGFTLPLSRYFAPHHSVAVKHTILAAGKRAASPLNRASAGFCCRRLN